MILRRYYKWYTEFEFSPIESRCNVVPAYTIVFDGNGNRRHVVNDNMQCVDIDDNKDNRSSDSSSNCNIVARNNSVMTNSNDNIENEQKDSKKSPCNNTGIKRAAQEMSYTEIGKEAPLKKMNISNNEPVSSVASKTAQHLECKMSSKRIQENVQSEINECLDIQQNESKVQLQTENMSNTEKLLKLYELETFGNDNNEVENPNEDQIKDHLTNEAIFHNFKVLDERKEIKELCPEMSLLEMCRRLPLRPLF